MILRPLLVALVVALAPAVSLGDGAQTFSFGGDEYAAGEQVTIQSPVAHDAFMAGRDVSLTGAVSGNAHLFGMNVTSAGGVNGSLYAAAFTVNVDAPVGGAISATGNTISVRAPATIGGNAHLAGASVTLAAPVAGSALVSAQSLTLDGAVGGDFSFYGQNLTFGPNARVAGSVLIRAPKPIAVPASVAPASRVTYQELQNPDYASQAGNAATGAVSGLWPGVWASAAWWLLLFLVGAAFILWAPRISAALQTAAATRPWRNFGLGVMALAAAFGLVPLAAMSLVGIVLLPFILLFAVALCGLGYVAGAFHLGLRLIRPLLPVEGNGRRVAVLAVAVVVAGVLSAIPVLGWLIGLTLTIFGTGVIVVALLDHWAARDAAKATGGPTPV
jgi:hypothetical protein